MWVVVPVKRFSAAKSRLASVLSEAERESLAQAMLNDVLRALGQCERVSGFVVVSREARAGYAAERSGGLFLDEATQGLSAALQQAGHWLAQHGRRDMAMIPGDIPLVSAREIDQLINAHRGTPAITLVPNREREGTNAIAVSPAEVIPFAFGAGSFAKHCQAAARVGIEPRVLELAGVALDIDNPLDLQSLLTHDAETETLAYLCDSGIARRVMPRHASARDISDSAAASRLL